ncbi:MAG: type II CRISPR RNA-guided endonuclease Cas9 [Candidatus Obscuribacterales bacterium]|nr:type II CRISPR RNA-guided endonuclease Cas9 [Candidatus Obscuribacterales bacterium]
MSTKTILGLDIGTNSIGWALIAADEHLEPNSLIDCGVRIFEKPVNAKDQTPLNAARRKARLQRRQLSRRKARKIATQKILQAQKLLPIDQDELEKLMLDDVFFNPYALRAKALNEKLSDFEIGRVLMHLAQRRGFKSNRKTLLAEAIKSLPEIAAILEEEEQLEEKQILEVDQKSKKKQSKDSEEGIIKSGISQVRQSLLASNSPTLGVFLNKIRLGEIERPTSDGTQKTIRGLYLDRAMYEHEFEAIWTIQSRHNPIILTDALKAALYKAIFHQRPLKTQKFLVGDCVFEYHRKRAPKATLEFQKYRILEQLTNIRIKDPLTRRERPLAYEESESLFQELQTHNEVSWRRVRKIIGLHSKEEINLEEGGKPKLLGNRVNTALLGALGEQWTTLTDERKSLLLTDLLTIHRKEDLIKRLIGQWKFTARQAYDLAILELEPGYCSYSIKALKKILSEMEKGLDVHNACSNIGYLAPTRRNSATSNQLSKAPNLRNPIANRALNQCRIVINALLKRYPRPDVIRIELARDMKLTKRQKEQAEKQNKRNRDLNDEARPYLQANGITQPSRNDLLKYRLWKELGGICAYSGKAIPISSLFTGEIEIDHIVPYARCWQDSYTNKTVCYAEENRIKRKQTPYEAFSSDPEKYREMLQRIYALDSVPLAKKKRFEEQDFKADDFLSSQLNDTRYICQEVRSYFHQLGIPVQITKGEATASLRRRWYLDGILSVDSSTKKNRADYRNHTIDAIVVALTSVSLFQLLSKLSGQSDLPISSRNFDLPLPWATFREDVDKQIREIVVSHAPDRRLRDAFHEQTAFGVTDQEGLYVKRIPLTSLKEKDVELISDKWVRNAIKQRFQNASSSDAKKIFAEPLFHADAKTQIRQVRLPKKIGSANMRTFQDRKGKYFKAYELGNNSHAELFRRNGKLDMRVVSMLEAANRVRRRKQPVVNKDDNFVMSLFKNDMVELTHESGKFIYKVIGLENSVDQRRLIMQLHTVASAWKDVDQIAPELREITFLKKVPSYYDARNLTKLRVDPLGKIEYSKNE